MKMGMWHSVSVALMLLFGPMQNGCSSSSQQQGAEENLEPSEENQQQEAGNEEETEQGNEAANEEGGEEANASEEGAENAEGGENSANEEGEGEASDEVVDEEQLTNDEGVTQADQQGDLQEIIEEMNQGEGNAAAAAEGGNMTESVMAENNVTNTSEPAGAANMANPAVEDIGGGAPTNAAAPVDSAPVAEAPAAAPAGMAAAPGLPEMGSKMSYIVQKGDTLGKIAQKIYGNPAKWNEIATFTGLANPKLIYPGDVVYYQLSETTQAFASTYESMARAEVQVQQGDTLSTIAGRVLGDSSSWKLIWRQNDGINDPDKLVAGTTLFYVQPGAVSAALDSMKDSFAAVRALVENFDTDQTVSGSELDSFEADFYYQQFDNNDSTNLI